MKEIHKYQVPDHFSIREAVKKMDEGGIRFCACINDKDKVIGVITDGDFRHAIHNAIQLDENVMKIVNKNYYSVQTNFTNEEIDDIFNNTIVHQIPVLHNGKLLDIITEENFFGIEKDKKRRNLNIHVVIMAGGRGTRLDPFTRILPKPLIPLGNEPIIKVIMNEFGKFGMKNFFISLRDKGEMIKAYFHDYDIDYNIKYLHKNKPLGTIGALKNLEGYLKDTFFVSNCDIIIHTNYSDFYDFHKKGNYSLSIIGSMIQYTIPYGICEIDDGGVLKHIKEKPQYDFLVNTGLYLLEPNVLKFIPQDKFFDMTDLISKVKENGLKIGIFPISENSWIDVGQLSDYKNIISKLTVK